MAGNDQSVPSNPLLAGWDESAGWRETHLHRFTRLEDAATLRHLSGMLYDFALENAGHWPDTGESLTRQQVRAAAADLKHLAGYLAGVGQERELSTLEPEDAALSEVAGRLAEEVGRLAERLAAAVG